MSDPSSVAPKPHPRDWMVLILGFVGFVTSFGAHIATVNLPIYAEQVGVGVSVIGVLIAAYDVAEIVAKPMFGALADRRSMKDHARRTPSLTSVAVHFNFDRLSRCASVDSLVRMILLRPSSRRCSWQSLRALSLPSVIGLPLPLSFAPSW
jgi:MFS family permease